MAVPRLPLAVPHLDVAHAALDEPAGDEHLPPLGVVAVAVADMLWLAGDVEGLPRLCLHAPGQLHRGQPGLELWVVVAGGQVPAVERRRQIELAALGIAVEEWVADILDEVLHLPLGGVDVGSLIRAGEKGVAPVLRALDRIPTRAHRHEAGEILIFRPQAVGHPRPDGGADEPAIAAIHEHQRRLVIGDIGVHRANDEEPVGMPGHRWKQIADLQPALAVATEGERRGERRTGATFGGKGAWDLLTGILLQRDFAIEGVEVARPSVGEEMDHGPGPRGEVRRPRRERAVDRLW